MPDATSKPGAEDEPLLTAARVLAWRAGQRNATVPRLPEAAVLTHQPSLLPRRRPWGRDAYRGAFSFDARPVAGGAMTLVLVRGVGAPATAIAVEELAAAGVRRLIAVDIGGSIEPALGSGGVLVADSAIACDGTSAHYAPDRIVAADEGLVGKLAGRLTAVGIGFTTGRAWSTGAVYRETPALLGQARSEGAMLADMETACLFAVARALGIEAAAVLVAADEVHDAWRPPSDMSAVNAGLRGLLAAATATLLP